VWRQKEAAVQSSHLSRLLLANSAHEVRTPLNAIINYLEIALEGVLDQETRDNLAKSHSASKSLIYVINDLLDLTKTEEGQELIRDEVFDLPATVREAADSFSGDAKRKRVGYEVVVHPDIPQYVQGDSRRVRQAIANITANAMQHTSKGWIRVEVLLHELLHEKVTVEIAIEDTGSGMSNDKLDALFRDLEQVSTDLDVVLPESGDTSRIADGQEKRTLGLGLAMVARIVRNMDGQLRLKSEEGQGSRFVVQLPFTVFRDSLKSSDENERLKLFSSMTPNAIGEVTLVEKSSSFKAEGVIQKRQTEESNSIRSYKSGSSNRSNRSNKSDVDRLIDAISSSLAVEDPDKEEWPLQRSNSKGSGHRKATGSLGNASAAQLSIPNERSGEAFRRGSLTRDLRNASDPDPGSAFITDQKTMMRAVKMPDEFSKSPRDEVTTHAVSKVLFDPLHRKTSIDAKHLQVLVAEDDPVNSRIIQKRLEKSGHEVHTTINGEECSHTYEEKSDFFDVILMDMQVSSLLLSLPSEALFGEP
jgi:hypothetical protein